MNDDDTGNLGPSVEEILTALLSGVPPVSWEPRVEITQWAVMAVEGSWGKSHHVVGISGANEYSSASGRVCSPIQHFDPEKREVTTRSGRVYYFAGEPGITDDLARRRVEEIRTRWLEQNGLGPSAFTDVTDAYSEKLK